MTDTTINLTQEILINDKVTPHSEYVEIMKKEHQDCFDYFTGDKVEWEVPEGLLKKIKKTGQIKAYYGNTVAFNLSEIEKESLQKLQTSLREKLDFLAEPLSKEKFHLTLHDLFHATSMHPIIDPVANCIEPVAESFMEITKIANSSDKRYIELIPSMVLPSVNTSMVVTYLPKNEDDYKTLFNIHKKFDHLQKLPYFYRPHVTLDYFVPTELSEIQLSNLKETLIEMNKQELPPIKLDLLELKYQLFSSMDDYDTIHSTKQ